jgi:hypothetical protein
MNRFNLFGLFILKTFLSIGIINLNLYEKRLSLICFLKKLYMIGPHRQRQCNYYLSAEIPTLITFTYVGDLGRPLQ